MINWQDSYSTGIAQIDAQHKNLFQYCNDLEEGLSRGVCSKQTLDGALKFLGNYVRDHFGQEEMCMHQYACPIAEKNKIAHQKFINAYNMFQNTLSEDGDNEPILRGLHHFLESWLRDHIGKIDVQLKSCVT